MDEIGNEQDVKVKNPKSATLGKHFYGLITFISS